MLTHEPDVVSHEIVFVQLQFESEGVIAKAAFERSITPVVSRNMMVLRESLIWLVADFLPL